MRHFIRSHRLLAHSGAGLIGIWVCVAVYVIVNLLGTALFPPAACSGLPFCGTSGTITLLLALVLGGVSGTAIAYIVAQSLLQRPINHDHLLQSLAIGAFVWVGVGALWLIYFLVIAASHLEQRLGATLVDALSISLSGISAGFVAGLFRPVRKTQEPADRTPAET